MHEAALKAQAKKMNVESLRAGDQSGDSVEFKIAKVNLLLTTVRDNLTISDVDPEYNLFRIHPMLFMHIWKL